MNAFSDQTVSAFVDELVKIGSIDELEKEAILGRLAGKLTGKLSPEMLAAARMGEKEIAQIAGRGGLGSLRGAGRAGMATQPVKSGLGSAALQRAGAGRSVGKTTIGV